MKVNSKKQALQELAARAAILTGQNERSIFEVLLQREKLGTTAVGYGVAIPHGKLPKLDKLSGLFARLDRPIDFEAMDGQPVDLCFCCWRLKVPARTISRRWRASRGCCAIRTSQEAACIKRRTGAVLRVGAAAGDCGLRLHINRIDKLVVPAQAGTRHPCRRCYNEILRPSTSTQKPVVMGPGLRRDDEREYRSEHVSRKQKTAALAAPPLRT